jgi:hypothetical protein
MVQRSQQGNLHKIIGVGEVAGALGQAAVGPSPEAGEEPADELIAGCGVAAAGLTQEDGGRPVVPELGPSIVRAAPFKDHGGR